MYKLKQKHLEQLIKETRPKTGDFPITRDDVSGRLCASFFQGTKLKYLVFFDDLVTELNSHQRMLPVLHLDGTADLRLIFDAKTGMRLDPPDAQHIHQPAALLSRCTNNGYTETFWMTWIQNNTTRRPII